TKPSWQSANWQVPAGPSGQPSKLSPSPSSQASAPTASPSPQIVTAQLAEPLVEPSAFTYQPGSQEHVPSPVAPSSQTPLPSHGFAAPPGHWFSQAGPQ